MITIILKIIRISYSECLIERVYKTSEQNNCCAKRNRSLFYQDKDWLRSAEYKQAIVWNEAISGSVGDKSAA